MSGATRPSAPSPAPPSAPEGGRAGYEFSDEDRESIRALAASMAFVGACLMLFGAMSGLFALGAGYAGFAAGGLGLGAGALVCVVAGWWTVSAGRALSALVGTRGRDVDRLMEAIAQLRRLFGFARVAVIVCALFGAAVAGVIYWCTFVVEKGGRCVGWWG